MAFGFPIGLFIQIRFGQYSIGCSPGKVDTLRVRIPSAYVENVNPPEYAVTNSGNNRNFGVHFKPNITDVSIVGYNESRPRPGYPLRTDIVYRNEGTIPSSGKISVKLDPKYKYINADPAPSADIGADSLIWDFDSIPIFNFQRIHINGMVDSSAVIGNLLKLKGHIEPFLVDFMPTNNFFMLSDSIRGSHDPNDKRVQPAVGLTPNEIASGKELLYTIRFQKTGNLPADRVRITDKLDTALDVSTLRLVASSHEISSFRLLPGNLLEVVFNNINLKDSSSNELESHGFISFAIQRNKIYKNNYKIQNTAAIYFDFNEPIFTNTVVTPLATTVLATFEPKPIAKEANLLISPNPSSKDCVVDTRGRLSGSGDIVVFDEQGKICLTQHVDDFSIPINLSLNNLSNGAYIVRATAKKGLLVW